MPSISHPSLVLLYMNSKNRLLAVPNQPNKHHLAPSKYFWVSAPGSTIFLGNLYTSWVGHLEAVTFWYTNAKLPSHICCTCGLVSPLELGRLELHSLLCFSLINSKMIFSLLCLLTAYTFRAVGSLCTFVSVLISAGSQQLCPSSSTKECWSCSVSWVLWHWCLFCVLTAC